MESGDDFSVYEIVMLYVLSSMGFGDMISEEETE